MPVLGGLKVGLLGERFLLDIFDKVLPHLGGAVVDVGANVGQTLAKVKLADPARRYFGFEPNPACFYYLETLVKANGWHGVSLFPVGLSYRTAIETLHAYSDRQTDPTGSFKPDARPELDEVYTKPVSVFDYAAVDEHIDAEIGLLKIDVEGAEHDVLTGMRARIERDLPLVIFELMTVPAMEARHQQTLDLFQAMGYRVQRIRRDTNRRWAGLEPMASYRYEPVPGRSDYLAVPDRLAATVARVAPAA